MMPLNILIIEDSPADAELIATALAADGIEARLTRVETEAEFTPLLKPGVDLILSDYTLPRFSMAAALEILRQTEYDIPFIVVSGTIGEDRAVEAVRTGATDYVLKDRLKRLGPVVGRALRERDDRRQRLELEDQIRQAQKMESIGQLAGGVAHDFNNILTVIHGHASILMSGPDFPQPVRDSAEEISLAAERAARLTRQLLTFSRKQISQPRLLDIIALVGDLTRMLHRIVGDDIVLSLELASDLALVRADTGMIEQLIMNLALNAREAMPHGGKLTLSGANQTIDDDYTRLHPQGKPGSYICISVADTGPGIPREILPRIFEPFFTTKAPGKGSGLGLATVYGIARQHQGWVTVSSEPGAGAVFRVYLPAVGARPETVRSEPSAPSHDVPRGHETILLAEDEPSVRLLTRRILEHYGYTILEAPSGTAALELWKRPPTPIHLVLTDIVMPGGLTGLELGKAIHEENPDVPIIYVSGYSVEVFGENANASSLLLLPKPYTAVKLARLVRETLDKASKG